MEKFLRVTMPDGSLWDVPARVIADNRAKYYAEGDPGEYEEEFRFTMDDNFELRDWAANNMDWDEVKSYAVKVEEPPQQEPDYQEGWVNGDKKIVEK